MSCELYPFDPVHQSYQSTAISDFVSASHGVGCLMCYGQAQAGKEGVMYGEAGSRVNFTPRGLPAPGHQPGARNPGLVLHAFRTVLGSIPTMQQPVEVEMGCVMLHMELLKDLLSPQRCAPHTRRDARRGQSWSRGVHPRATTPWSRAEPPPPPRDAPPAARRPRLHVISRPVPHGTLVACEKFLLKFWSLKIELKI